MGACCSASKAGANTEAGLAMPDKSTCKSATLTPEELQIVEGPRLSEDDVLTKYNILEDVLGAGAFATVHLTTEVYLFFFSEINCWWFSNRTYGNVRHRRAQARHMR
jgi:hypothetical protein